MEHSRIPFLTLTLVTVAVFPAGLGGCSPVNPTTSSSTPDILCGNSICDNVETSLSCPRDCPQAGFSGQMQTTLINSEGIGDIAVMVAEPGAARYPEGAGGGGGAPPVF